MSFDDQIKFSTKENIKTDDVTNNKYQKKIEDVKNEKIKQSLLNLSKVFKQR